MSMYRLSGHVLSVSRRSGVSKTPDPVTGEMKPWVMHDLDVEIADLIVTSVSLRDEEVATYQGKVGQFVDLAVDVSAGRNGFMNARIRGTWPKQNTASRHAA